jgi:hypothetical protein
MPDGSKITDSIVAWIAWITLNYRIELHDVSYVDHVHFPPRILE